jgi:hypothetical protein
MVNNIEHSLCHGRLVLSVNLMFPDRSFLKTLHHSAISSKMQWSVLLTDSHFNGIWSIVWLTHDLVSCSEHMEGELDMRRKLQRMINVSYVSF